MAEQPTPKKTVRFQLDENDKPEAATPDTAPTQNATTVCKKTVQFALDGVKHSTLGLPTPTTPIVQCPIITPCQTPFTSCPSSDSNSSPTALSICTSGATTSTPRSPSEITTWSKPVSLSSSAMSPPPSGPSSPGFELSRTCVAVLHYDEGEKSADGKVLEPIPDELCEKCGGKIVWATKGEWYLICQGCQEPQ